MKNNKTEPTKEKGNPNQVGDIDIDQLAKLWIEMVLQQIQKRQSFSLKRVHKIILIDSLDDYDNEK